MPKNIMTFSKQIFPILFLFFIFLFPLRHASNPKKCSSSYDKPLSCGPSENPIRFPFCGHPRFNLQCNHLNKPVLELPMSGTFLVKTIDYRKQEIYINDPENCLVKRLLNFNVSGSPFSPRSSIVYTFLTCPNEGVKRSWYPPSIPCLSNSTSSFFATSSIDLANSMLPSCKIVKSVSVPISSPRGELDFLSYVDNQSLMLEWHSPNCRSCEMNYLRCGFKKKGSLQVKCLGRLSTGELVLVIISSIIGAITLFAICITIRIYNSRRFASPRRQHALFSASTATLTPQPRETMVVPRGLDQSTIESYKKMELGESRRLLGSNDIVCTICLSEYASKETVRFIPKCNHCFHVECIDPWLKIHGSCPLCRNSRA